MLSGQYLVLQASVKFTEILLSAEGGRCVLLCAMEEGRVSIPHNGTFPAAFWGHQLSLESGHGGVVERYGLVSLGKLNQCKQGWAFKLCKSTGLNPVWKLHHFSSCKL